MRDTKHKQDVLESQASFVKQNLIEVVMSNRLKVINVVWLWMHWAAVWMNAIVFLRLEKLEANMQTHPSFNKQSAPQHRTEGD